MRSQSTAEVPTTNNEVKRKLIKFQFTDTDPMYQ
jgi:hypothetical protein